MPRPGGVLAAAVLLACTGTAAAAPTRSSPLAVAPDGRALVVNPDAGTVARVGFAPAPGGGVAGTLEEERPVGASPRTLALAGDWVFTADQGADSVTRRRRDALDAERWQVDLGFGCAPYGIAARPDGRGLVVTCQGTSQLVLLDLDLREQARVRLPWPTARAVAVSDAGEAYVTHFLTPEPTDDAHVSVVDLARAAVARVLAIPPDTTTCETQNSGQGVLNLVSAVALMPDEAPEPVRGQVWVGGTLQNVLTKGLFARDQTFADAPGAALFPRLGFAPFPAGAPGRNVYKAAFHDVLRSGLVKLDRASGAVVGRIAIDEGGSATDVELSADGRVAYVVDEVVNALHVFSTARGQDGDPTTLFGGPAATGPGGVDPGRGCVAEALRSVTPEAPFRRAPQAQIAARDPDPRRPTGDPAAPYVAVATGVDFDAGHFLRTGERRMHAVPDGIGTAPIGVRLDAARGRVHVASYLSRTLAVAAAAEGPSPGLRCTQAPDVACTTTNDCGDAGGQCAPLLLGDATFTVGGGAGRCAVPAGRSCARDAECDDDPGFCSDDGAACAADGGCRAGATCVRRPVCVVLAGDVLDAALLDGKILFTTAARDASTTNRVGVSDGVPRFNDPASQARVPGGVVSTAREASYVGCASCHADHGGHDGRTWDFGQLGSSLRNTMDLRGRSQVAPGRCSDDPAVACVMDAACGAGGVCRMDDALVPPHVHGADRARWFNPMLSVHWNGDRDEVEDFEHTFRSLLGAGDCDGAEFSDACTGGLVQRSADTSVDPVDVPPPLGAPARNLRGPRGSPAGVRLTHLADYVYSLSAFPRNPQRGDDAVAMRGRDLFADPAVGCAGCHDGPAPGRQLFTDRGPNPTFDGAAEARGDGNNPFVRHDVGTANAFDLADPYAVAAAAQSWQNPGLIPASRGPLTEYVTPVLVDVWSTAPYLHDGSAPTLLDVVRACDTALDDCLRAGRGRNLRVDGVERHGRTGALTPSQLNDLVAFLRALDTTTPLPRGTSTLAARAVRLDRVTLALPGHGRRQDGVLRVRATLPDAEILAGGPVTLSLATPDGERMAIVQRTLAVPGDGRRRRAEATDAGLRLRLGLRPRGDGVRVVLRAVGPALAALDTGNADLTVALERRGVQWVQGRTLRTPRPARRSGRLVLRRSPG